MRKLLILLSCTFLTLSLSSCSSKKEDPAPEPTQTEEQATPAANDYDTQEHYTVIFGDYELEIPDNYRNKEPYYYVESTGHNDLAMLYLLHDTTTAIPSYELLALNIDTYIKGLLSESEDAKITDKHETTINGIPMYVLSASGTISGVEGVLRDYVFVNPSDKALMSLIFVQENTTVYDHFDDLDRIVSSIRPAD